MIEKKCATCEAPFMVQPCEANRARYCSRSCLGKSRAATMLGNKHRAGMRPTNAFQRGGEPWNAGVKGVHLSPASEFPKGHVPANRAPLGEVRIRQARDDGQRAWVKTAEPNTWRPRAVLVWEAAHGDVPRGFIVHHENRHTLDDSIGNLSLVSRAEHLMEHRPEFEARRAAAASAARWGGHRESSRAKSGP